uniref:Uncharacterized protein n=1 Tax=Pseudo-nitzschia australis TaxID=44445 RepID=A0A7S4ARD2_9STRA
MIPAHHPPGNLLCSFVLRHRQIHNSRRLSSLLSGGGYRSAGSTKEGKNNGSLSLSLSLSLLFHRVSAPRMRVGENPHLYRLPTARGSIRQRSTLTALQELVRSGALQPDRAQERVAKRLDRLQAALADYDNSVLFPQTQKQSSGESPSSEKREDDQTDDKEQERLLDLDATNDKTKKKTTAAKTNQCNDIDNDNDSDNNNGVLCRNNPSVTPCHSPTPTSLIPPFPLVFHDPVSAKFAMPSVNGDASSYGNISSNGKTEIKDEHEPQLLPCHGFHPSAFSIFSRSYTCPNRVSPGHIYGLCGWQ